MIMLNIHYSLKYIIGTITIINYDVLFIFSTTVVLVIDMLNKLKTQYK